MITISPLVAGPVCDVMYYVVGTFTKGQPLNIIGLVPGLFLLLYVPRAFNIAPI